MPTDPPSMRTNNIRAPPAHRRRAGSIILQPESLFLNTYEDRERLSSLKTRSNESEIRKDQIRWEVKDFNTFTTISEFSFSDFVDCFGYRWRLSARANTQQGEPCLALRLHYEGAETVQASVRLAVVNRSGRKDKFREFKVAFGPESNSEGSGQVVKNWGYNNMISLSDLSEQGLVMDDKVVFRAEIEFRGNAVDGVSKPAQKHTEKSFTTEAEVPVPKGPAGRPGQSLNFDYFGQVLSIQIPAGYESGQFIPLSIGLNVPHCGIECHGIEYT